MVLWSDVYHRSPIWIIIYHTYLLSISLHRTILQTTILNFWNFILVTVLPFNRNFNKKYLNFNCGVIPTHCKYVCILALTTLKITTRVAQTWQLSLYNKITFKTRVHFLVFVINVIHVLVVYWVSMFGWHVNLIYCLVDSNMKKLVL
jgi:hypothetical protein